MSKHMEPEHHIVTVLTETEEDWTYIESIEFTCSAAEDAPCRAYPECDCEVFTEDDGNPGHDCAGHPYVSGRDCWVLGWFAAESCGEATTYTGHDRGMETDCGVPLVAQHGHVKVAGFSPDIGPEWEWYGDPKPLDVSLDQLALIGGDPA